MTIKKILGIMLLVAALGLAAWTYFKQGNSFGFRSHPAVIREVIGNVELRSQTARPQRARAGHFLPRSVTVLSPAYATALLAVPQGELRLYDASKLRCEDKSGQDEWLLVRGRLDVDVDSSGGLRLRAADSGTGLELMAGNYEFMADGKGMLLAHVIQGTALIYEDQQRPTEVSAGQFFMLTPLAPALIAKSLPKVEMDLQLSPRHRPGELSTITGKVSPGVRVFVNGEPSFPGRTGDFAAALAPGEQRAVIVVETLGQKNLHRVFTVQR